MKTPHRLLVKQNLDLQPQLRSLVRFCTIFRSPGRPERSSRTYRIAEVPLVLTQPHLSPDGSELWSVAFVAYQRHPNLFAA